MPTHHPLKGRGFCYVQVRGKPDLDDDEPLQKLQRGHKLHRSGNLLQATTSTSSPTVSPLPTSRAAPRRQPSTTSTTTTFGGTNVVSNADRIPSEDLLHKQAVQRRTE